LKRKKIERICPHLWLLAHFLLSMAQSTLAAPSVPKLRKNQAGQFLTASSGRLLVFMQTRVAMVLRPGKAIRESSRNKNWGLR